MPCEDWPNNALPHAAGEEKSIKLLHPFHQNCGIATAPHRSSLLGNKHNQLTLLQIWTILDKCPCVAREHAFFTLTLTDLQNIIKNLIGREHVDRFSMTCVSHFDSLWALFFRNWQPPFFLRNWAPIFYQTEGNNQLAQFPLVYIPVRYTEIINFYICLWRRIQLIVMRHSDGGRDNYLEIAFFSLSLHIVIN